MPYRKFIFSLKDITFYGDISLGDTSFYGWNTSYATQKGVNWVFKNLSQANHTTI